ncbi:type II secretion system protein N [Kangiella koreensis]|uniref:Type II secretory pathway component PulC-like protein n=1 Tax=Kangiella koreensis (strain DSM 16069 / JCM 12317 / KCTC 12182 / SW-125) TaxID=523791 RepID=C7R8G1_KANKD|nr:type II secretion system protein N [Kangiella koreensis]ACV27726.1 Type II secretory pathway component PulC-like protein [Kangiella koreensis DSM 16069]
MNPITHKINQFVQQRGRLIAQVLAVLLTLLTLYIVAKLIWLWIGFFQPPPQIETVAINQPQQTKRAAVDVNKLVSLHVFGEAGRVEEQVVQAEETRLNLKLLGTYVSTDAELSSAIIQANARDEKAYFMNDKLEVSGNVVLHKVETLQVVLKNNGRLETLTLEEQLDQSALSDSQNKMKPVDSSQERTIDKRRDSRLSSELSEMKDKVFTDPQSLADLAKFEQVVDESGVVTGYKVAPGSDPRMFARLGLRRNDVIKSVNGTQLNEQGLLGIANELTNTDSLEISIERDGQPVTLLLGLSELSQQQKPDPNERRIQ